MAKISLILLSYLSLTLFSTGVYSQNNLHPDSLKTGMSYKFVLYNDTEVIGKITGQDSLYISLYGSEGSYRIKKEDIFIISRNLNRKKFKVMLSLGGGISILSDEIDGNSYNNFKGKYSFQLSALLPIGENKGIRIDAGYSKWKKDEFTYTDMYQDGYSRYGEQTKDAFGIKGDFVYGMISPENKFWIQGNAGFGISHIVEGPSDYEHVYYSSYDSTYHYSSYFYETYRYTSGVLSLGCSLGYRFSRQFGVYADVQYNLLTRGSYFFFFWGGGSGHIPLRAGLTYTIY